MIKLLSVAIIAGLISESTQQPAPGYQCWTRWFNGDNPGGSGDIETLANLHRVYPGQICSKPLEIEVTTRYRLCAHITGDVFFKKDATVGFICRNKDQSKFRRCQDYRVRFRCPAAFCQGCWTPWSDRDNPSGTGDWENLYNLHREYPGKICSNPVAIEARTLTGLSAAAAGNVIFRNDVTTGFVCRNQDQPGKKRCSDYRVRFRCPAAFCQGCYTQYFDRDNPGGKGDFEILAKLRQKYPGKICANPLGIEARTRAGLSAAAAGNVIHKTDTAVGFVCRNRDQPGNKRCQDYKVRFRCPASFCKDCWTPWFDRDNPSGTGDWENLYNLHREYPGQICSNPVGIEVTTRFGQTLATAGNVIFQSDPTSGFVCRNQDQPPHRRCQDYRVRFRCPADFCDGCFTQYFDRDNPGGKGDFEILSRLRTENPGKICPTPVAIEARTVAGLTPAAAGDVITRNDVTRGFVCRNQDQPGKRRCSDYKVRFRCPAAFCQVPCYTQYFDRDDPTVTGDWETVTDLRTENPGKICSNPIAIEAVTLGGLTPTATGDVIYKSDTIVGFVCRIQDQPNRRLCQDYKVRFRCPAAFCQVTVPGCYTQYFDRDNPSGNGDYEILSHLRPENPGKICSNPIAIDVKTVTGFSPTTTGDVFFKNDVTTGFVCRNRDQPGKKRCSDYKVRFRCPAAFCQVPCYTQYFDRDDPTVTGDWETVTDLRTENPGKICSNPIAIEAVTLGGLTPTATGDVIYKSDTIVGFVCRIQDQPNRRLCQDYKVRFRCPAAFCQVTVPGCYTQYFDRDNPSGNGDYEILSHLRPENPGKICSNPIAIDVKTVTGLSPTTTGDVFFKNDVTTGFVCRNRDQPGNKRCSDYKVRFRCPAAFCQVTVPGCYTQYFDRDNPTVTGDWETVTDLRTENPGKICSNPIAIEAVTLGGLTPTATGDVIYKSDTIVGFVCRIQDQPNRRLCQDYKVRFRCPAAFCQVTVPGCYTQYFDRDNPSGNGDYEILSHLRPENPGKICSNPIAIDVKTVTGHSPATTGDVFFKNDVTTGFVCRNRDQPGKKRCSDYKVRFRCPAAFCQVTVPGCYTQYFDRDNPSGNGDYEILSHLRPENPGKICSNPIAIDVKTVTGLSPTTTGDVFFKNDVTTGFVCRNRDQPGKKRCSDYKVRFRCPAAFCQVPGPACYTQYFDRDDPTVTGDWETVTDLRTENPGKICSNPIAIEAVTLGGLTPTATGDVIYKSDTIVGFVCRIQDQPNRRLCQDYKVRFRCPAAFCQVTVLGCYTQYFDRDNPSGNGDYEILSHLRPENPGKICSNPIAIDVKTVTGFSPTTTGDVFFKNDVTTGFVCRNRDQPGKKRCSDYKVRFRCPAAFCQVPGPACYTQYFDRDDPTVTGDWETVTDLRTENPGKICSNPIAIEAVTLGGLTPTATGDVIYKSDTIVGFVCRIQDQPNRRLCQDYKVRFRCPAAFCQVTVPGCYTQYFDRDNPSGNGDYEILSHLRPENPGKICSNPIAIDVKTVTGFSPTTTGDVFFKNDVTTGFVCRNRDQPGKKRCSDYKVRFRCPAAFCQVPGPACYTQYFDRDDPTVTGDWETVTDLRTENPGKICSNPIAIEAVTLGGLTPTATGDVIYKSDTIVGFVCRIQDQPNRRLCQDYKVRFRCPAAFCQVPGCYTQYFDRDNPSGNGDYEILSHLRPENPGKICSNPIAIDVKTVTGFSPTTTGDVFFKNDVTTGFVCRNRDQPGNKRCSDYKVRFRCPAAFCKR